MAEESDIAPPPDTPQRAWDRLMIGAWQKEQTVSEMLETFARLHNNGLKPTRENGLVRLPVPSEDGDTPVRSWMPFCGLGKLDIGLRKIGLHQKKNPVGDVFLARLEASSLDCTHRYAGKGSITKPKRN